MPPNDFDNLNRNIKDFMILISFTPVLLHKIYDMPPMSYMIQRWVDSEGLIQLLVVMGNNFNSLR